MYSRLFDSFVKSKHDREVMRKTYLEIDRDYVMYKVVEVVVANGKGCYERIRWHEERFIVMESVKKLDRDWYITQKEWELL